MKQFLSALLVSSLLLVTGAQAYAAGAAAAPPAAGSNTGDESLSVAGKRARIVGRSALYGFGGGLVVGLASQVFQKKPKNILLFGSLGLYAGIILGVYVITTSSAPAPYEGPDTYDDFTLNQHLKSPGLLDTRTIAHSAKADVKVNFVDLSF